MARSHYLIALTLFRSKELSREERVNKKQKVNGKQGPGMIKKMRLADSAARERARKG